jgi:predicted neuraminidase
VYTGIKEKEQNKVKKSSDFFTGHFDRCAFVHSIQTHSFQDSKFFAANAKMFLFHSVDSATEVMYNMKCITSPTMKYHALMKKEVTLLNIHSFIHFLTQLRFISYKMKRTVSCGHRYATDNLFPLTISS